MHKGKLVICPTPLGNLGDITQRTLDALCTCDVVFCEDTRVTGKLLAALGVSKPLERMDEATIGKAGERVLERVAAGQVVAYCSDAGMPGVSDPGARLVALVRQAGHVVEVLPGPTAVATAYVASGFTTPSFYFGGFFPRKAGERQAVLEQLAGLDAALIFYESPNRVVAALQAIAQALPLRNVALCRELTKLHEEVLVATAGELAAQLTSRDAIKGEIALVIDAPSQQERATEAEGALEAATLRAQELLAQQDTTPKSAAKLLQEEFGLSRNDAYALVQSLK